MSRRNRQPRVMARVVSVGRSGDARIVRLELDLSDTAMVTAVSPTWGANDAAFAHTGVAPFDDVGLFGTAYYYVHDNYTVAPGEPDRRRELAALPDDFVTPGAWWWQAPEYDILFDVSVPFSTSEADAQALLRKAAQARLAAMGVSLSLDEIVIDGWGEKGDPGYLEPIHMLYRGNDPLRPSKVPQKAGECFVLQGTQTHFSLVNSGYLTLGVRLQTPKPIARPEQIQWQLWAFDGATKVDYDAQTQPLWALPITAHEVLSGVELLNRWWADADLTQLGNSYLLDYEELTFALVLVRTAVVQGQPVKPSHAGTVKLAQIVLS